MNRLNNQRLIPIHASAMLTMLIAVFLLLYSSCQKTEDPAPEENEYLVSYEKVNNYSASFIKLMLGSMNSVYPGVDSLVDEVKYGIDLYKITYKTTYQGGEVTASGLVSIPASSESFPMLSFQNGTNTYKLNAPSINPADPLYTLMEMMASHGYIITIPDYIGFGSTSNILHPYYDQASSNQAVIDMMLAARELVGGNAVKAEFDSRHFLMGYSQGGWATLSALKHAESNYPESVKVIAASCGAGAYNITAMSDYVLQLDMFPGPLYLPYFIYSRIAAGTITQPLGTFFKEPFATRIPELFNGNYTNTEINEQLTDTISSLVTDELRLSLSTAAEFSSLRAAMSQNSVTAWNPSASIRFYHGTADLNVPPVQSEIIFTGFMNLGVSPTRVTLIPMPGATHETGLVPWGVTTIQWFDSLK